ncbi:family 20 glycosylhydrolase [Capnocytophaga canis]|uniref:family 20 glycosylhydrolase n=1 Tax=Capnocytophaga canis TaxID=1848903 RepID=UPI00385B9CAE
MKFMFTSLICLLTFYSYAISGVNHLLPKPQLIEINNSSFSLHKVRLSTPVLQTQWQNFIKQMRGTISDKANKLIEVKLVNDIPQARVNKEEAYTLSISKDKILIESTTEKGVYWAMQTLRQLATNKGDTTEFQGCYILDFPAFRFRGFMQDVGRTFISLEELKKEISILSQYKINVFHWHLTENQGWRLESKKHPILNHLSSYERSHGQFYTLDEAKELVEFCKQHNMILIPEIDMPGHSLAFRKAFNHDMQSEEGMKILKELLDEMLPYFDVPYFHIGTDEVEFTNPNFVPNMVQFIRERGKKVISWNPGWNYKAGNIDMTQLWSYRGKVQKDIPAIDSRFHYLNHFDAFGDIIALYNSRILNVTQGSDNYAGCILAVWNDRFIPNEQEILIQNNFYPSMLALAERSWLGGGTEYFDNKGTILSSKKDLNFIAFADFERRMLWHKNNYFNNLPFAYVKQTHMEWTITDPFPNEGDLTRSFPPEKELSNSYTHQGKTYYTQKTIGGGIYLRHVWGKIVKSLYENPLPNHTAYAYTHVYSPKRQKVGLWISTQNYSRSEKDLPPPQGKWDYKESRVWINNSEIHPPNWQSSHTQKSNETPLTNENFEVRPPIPVILKKGWNKILLKLPIGHFSTPEVRLVKWHFNFAFVSLDGKNEIQQLRFDADRKTQ